MTLEGGKLIDIIQEAKSFFPTKMKPQGSYVELAKALDIDRSTLYKLSKRGSNSMTVESLVKILNIIKAPHDILTPYIKSVGSSSNKEAIINPKFPINIKCPDGGRLLAAALKDGYINPNDLHFEYTNFDPKNLQIATESVQRVFGDIEPLLGYERDGRLKCVHFSSAVIGYALHQFGAVVGRKSEQDYNIPDPIRFGDRETRNAYFEQTVRDDGCRDYQCYQIIIIHARELESLIKLEHRTLIERLHWKDKCIPYSQATEPFVTLTRKLRDELTHELRPVYDDILSKMRKEWAPTILKEKKEILEETFGVKAELIPKKIYISKRVLRGKWHLVVRGKENFERMVKELDSVWKEGGEEER